jgi:hypothetical protein
MKLINIKSSTNSSKKLMATFEKTADDYTITRDKEQRARYRQRHKKDLETKDPTRAGFLSYYILWGDSTSRRENIANYKKRFNL